MIKSLILQEGLRKDDPAALLSSLNTFLEPYTSEHFITAFYGVYNFNNRTLLCSNAGHNYPILIDSNSASDIITPRTLALTVLGNGTLKEKNLQYTNIECTFEKGSRVLFYTDGLMEAPKKNSGDIYFGHEMIYNKLYTYRSHDCRTLVNNLYHDLIEFKGDEIFNDDICMICLEV